MRSREEIMAAIQKRLDEAKTVDGAYAVPVAFILEVVLDIRDLLAKSAPSERDGV